MSNELATCLAISQETAVTFSFRVTFSIGANTSRVQSRFPADRIRVAANGLNNARSAILFVGPCSIVPLRGSSGIIPRRKMFGTNDCGESQLAGLPIRLL